MSRNQKAPLLAFVLVALVCSLILVDSMRGEAFERRISVLAPTPVELPVSPQGREPELSAAGEQDGTDDLPIVEFSSSDVTQGPESESWTPLGSLAASSGAVPGGGSAGHPGQAAEGAPESVDQPPGDHGSNGGSNHGRRGHKNPNAANVGSDGGRPEIDPEDQEPIDEQPPGVDDPGGPDGGGPPGDADDGDDPGRAPDSAGDPGRSGNDQK